jgi:hypothetical protein
MSGRSIAWVGVVTSLLAAPFVIAQDEAATSEEQAASKFKEAKALVEKLPTLMSTASLSFSASYSPSYQIPSDW